MQTKIRIRMTSKFKLYIKITKWRFEYLWASIAYSTSLSLLIDWVWSFCHLQAKMVYFGTIFRVRLDPCFRYVWLSSATKWCFNCDNGRITSIHLRVGLRSSWIFFHLQNKIHVFLCSNYSSWCVEVLRVRLYLRLCYASRLVLMGL
jgi:hypothetical protein